MKTSRTDFLIATLFLSLLVSLAFAPTAQAQDSPREAAPTDLIGNWVSPIMEDWRWRMVTPLLGDAHSIPLRSIGRDSVDNWDPARDEAAGLACIAYGAPGMMRMPGRIQVSWEDDNTLKIEKDYGMQTRLLQFNPGEPGEASRQGHSVAQWDPGVGPPPFGLNGAGTEPRIGTQSKTLIVETSNLLAGYLRKNGVPYSDQTTVTEYFDTFTAVDGTEWFTITTFVEDPVYLAVPFVTTTDYKREADDSGWNPEPCSAY